MDHLPAPIDGHAPPVPFYAEQRTEYNPSDFHRIPIDYGYTDFEDLLDTGLSPQMGRSEMNQFLQSWLFFSLLARVLNTNIRVSDWHKEKDDTLTTQALGRVLNQWTDDWDNQHDDLQNDAFSADDYVQASMTLENARRFVGKHLVHRPYDHEDGQEGDAPDGAAGVHNQVDPIMVLSITSVAEVLQDRLWTRIPRRQKDRTAFWKQPEDEQRHWGYSKWCRKQMQDEGWCPFEIRRLEATMLRTNSIYYSCQIKRERSKLDHISADCTMWQCKARLTGICEELSALHMCGNRPSCQETHKIDESKLIEIIDRGEIPLLRYTYRGTLTCEGHSLADDDTSPRFLALSHSWTENTLHCGTDVRGGNNRKMLDCQLTKLRETYTKIFRLGDDEDGLFWIDVLCLPRDYRKKVAQLNQLHTIYKQAEAVLVWDRNLLGRLKSPKAKTIEMNVRVRTGEWALRLWTLPEAVLGRRLYISFQDGYLDIEKVIEAQNIARNDYNDPYHFLWRIGDPFSSSIRQLRDSKVQRVQRACEAVQFRLATKPEDETIVLGSILGLDISRLYDDKLDKETLAAARMKEFLDLLDETPGLGIPSGLVFLPRPRSTVNRNYNWAPRSWMTKQISTYALFRPAKETAYLLPKGLHVELSGVVLHTACPSRLGRTFWVPVSQNLVKWYKVKADMTDADWAGVSNQICGGGNSYILQNSAEPREKWELGLLVAHQGMLACGEVKWVKAHCRVWMRLESNTNVLKTLKKRFRENNDDMIYGERMKAQRWCIE